MRYRGGRSVDRSGDLLAGSRGQGALVIIAPVLIVRDTFIAPAGGGAQGNGAAGHTAGAAFYVDRDSTPGYGSGGSDIYVTMHDIGAGAECRRRASRDVEVSAIGAGAERVASRRI